ncbi:MAG TPA: GNAT family N-acetyltransferase [Usitatibacter sp.]|nr:GNAT family N-acetyltransferase [Usitatibacter sp.]
MQTSPTGYAHPGYARSLAEFGTPLELTRSGGWMLERPVAKGGASDAMGCYPLLFCRDWRSLREDLDALEGRIVSACAVPDPFGAHDEALLRDAFRDVVTPFKQHFFTDMHVPLEESVSRHHRKYARKALRDVDAEVVADPAGYLDEWLGLHHWLVARHEASGIRAFSPRAFAAQLSLPGAVVVRATHRGVPVGAQLWFQHEDVAYGHVLAFTPDGYQLGAPYALYWFALSHFVGKVRWCSFGGVSGTEVASPEGLARFKRGWATGTRTAYFCGRILDRARYDDLVVRAGTPARNFFPAYRTSF